MHGCCLKRVNMSHQASFQRLKVTAKNILKFSLYEKVVVKGSQHKTNTDLIKAKFRPTYFANFIPK